MTSEKQAEANRQNALQSTGPKSDEGKAIVARNALKHGLTARRILLPDEGEDELVRFGEQLRGHFEPVGEVEVLLVERIVAAAWRLRRVYRVEAGIFATQFHSVLAQRAEAEARGYERDTLLAGLLDTQTTITDQAKHADALARAKEAALKRDAEETALGAAFVRDATGPNAFSKLSRYEAAIERSMFRALRELERHQAARKATAREAALADATGASGPTEC